MGGSGRLGWSGSDKHLLCQRVPLCQPGFRTNATTFGITAGTFGATALFGYVTKKDLSKMGSILFMLLIGLIIASVVNMFLKNDTMMWILTYVGIVIFVGLTAYDMQKLKKIAHSIDDDESSIAKFAVLGALTLYLDFINLFLRLLQIFGKKR